MHHLRDALAGSGADRFDTKSTISCESPYILFKDLYRGPSRHFYTTLSPQRVSTVLIVDTLYNFDKPFSFRVGTSMIKRTNRFDEIKLDGRHETASRQTFKFTKKRRRNKKKEKKEKRITKEKKDKGNSVSFSHYYLSLFFPASSFLSYKENERKEK